MVKLNSDEQVTLELIVKLKEIEMAAARFYAACAAEYSRHRQHWLFMQTQEEEHVVLLGQVESDFLARPHRWKRGRIMPETVQFITTEICNKTRLITDRKMGEPHAVTFSIDFESSLIEKELLASISVGDVEFEQRLLRLRTETEDHRQRLMALNREVRS